MAYRRTLIASNAEEAAGVLEGGGGRTAGAPSPAETRPVAFLFPGQGSQHVGMARRLYASEEVFRRQVDSCCEVLEPHLGAGSAAGAFSVGRVGYRRAFAAYRDRSAGPLCDRVCPGSFVDELGVQPKALIGHSIGEYVAACLAGVFSLEDALALVAARGRLSEGLPGGAMLAVALAEDEARSLLTDQLALAAVNSPTQCVVSGPEDDIEALRESLAQRQVRCRRLETRHAFHSPLVRDAMGPFRPGGRGRHPAATGAALPLQCHRHLDPPAGSHRCGLLGQSSARDRALLARPANLLNEEKDIVLLEVGPGQSLSGFGAPPRGGRTSLDRHPLAAAPPTPRPRISTRSWTPWAGCGWPAPRPIGRGFTPSRNVGAWPCPAILRATTFLDRGGRGHPRRGRGHADRWQQAG